MFFAFISIIIQQNNAAMTDINYVSVSQQLLYAVRTGESSDTFIKLLEVADKTIVQKELSTDALKKTFWLNMAF